MNLEKNSRMKRKYFFNLYLVCSLLGIVPFYSFKKSQLVKQNLNKIWLVTLLGYKLLLITGYFILRYPEFQKENNLITVKILEHPAHLGYWMMPFTSVIVLLVNRKKWGDFLVRFMKINTALPLKKEKSLCLKYTLNFALNIIIFGYMFTNKEYFSYGESVVGDVWEVIYNLEELFWLYTNIFLNEIILNIKNRYEAVNQKLVQTINKSVENKFMSKDVVYLTVDQIKKIKQLYKDVTDLVDRFNILFSWSIFGLMTYTLLNTLSILNGLIVGGDLEWIATDSIELFVVIIYNIYVALSCDFTSYEGSKIIKLCYNLEENFPVKSPIRDELLQLAEQAKYFSPKFISVGLFNINRKILLSMVSTITTYIIIVIQFNNAQ